MARQTGYKVTITGFLPVDQKDIMSQKKALDALTGGYNELIPQLKHVKLDQKMTSHEVDAEGNPVPRAPRKPRTVKAAGKRAA